MSTRSPAPPNTYAWRLASPGGGAEQVARVTGFPDVGHAVGRGPPRERTAFTAMT